VTQKIALQNEEQAKKLEIARKYSRHKTFNPIKGTYYIDKINEEKELYVFAHILLCDASSSAGSPPFVNREEKQEKEAKRIQQRANLPQAITNRYDIEESIYPIAAAQSSSTKPARATCIILLL